MPNDVQLPTQQQVEDPLESPEVLIINALLEAPEGFRPEVYGVSKDMLAGWTKAFQFCVDHQGKTGEPPGKELFARTFPDFEILSGVRPSWAADKLRDAHHERELRRVVKDSLSLLNSGDVEGAQDALGGLLKRPTRHARPKGMGLFDAETVDDRAPRNAYAVPWLTLEQKTGGIAQGEFWGVGARLGEGKSQMLPLYADSMADVGARIAVYTIEMPKRAYIRRLHRVRARGDRQLQRALRSGDVETRQAALERLPRFPGVIDVFDPSDLEPCPRSMRLLAQDYQFIFIDHMGLLTDDKGRSVEEDSRYHALVSGELKRITLEHQVGIVIAMQINREGESRGWIPPKMKNIAGSDNLGRDLDGAVLMVRMGERTMLHRLAKNREERLATFYTKFEPEVGDFSEIDKREALARAREDGDRDD